MGLPKRKISKTRRDKRRTHWKLTPITFTFAHNAKTGPDLTGLALSAATMKVSG